jgi:hypothetical protein
MLVSGSSLTISSPQKCYHETLSCGLAQATCRPILKIRSMWTLFPKNLFSLTYRDATWPIVCLYITVLERRAFQTLSEELEGDLHGMMQPVLRIFSSFHFSRSYQLFSLHYLSHCNNCSTTVVPRGRRETVRRAWLLPCLKGGKQKDLWDTPAPKDVDTTKYQ